MGRTPPHDIEMERALLGALLLNPEAMFQVADLVSIDSFYAPKHRAIFDAMMGLYGKREPLDIVTVSSKLKERKLLKDIGKWMSVNGESVYGSSKWLVNHEGSLKLIYREFITVPSKGLMAMASSCKILKVLASFLTSVELRKR